MSDLEDIQPLDDNLPDLLNTQLMAGEVYLRFYRMSSGIEKLLWKKMFSEELSHVTYLNDLLSVELPQHLLMPKVNLDKVNEVCDRVVLDGKHTFMLRLESALRLEFAEMNYGLEALAADRFAKMEFALRYPGNIKDHLTDLLDQADRYMASPNIEEQVTKLKTLYPFSSVFMRKNSTTSVFPPILNR